jgi:phosphomannomutase/phosphoglucomutase
VAKAALAAPIMPRNNLPAHIFRAYDIRGVVDDALTPEVVCLIGKSLGSHLVALGEETLIVGCDGRLSSPTLKAAFCEGVQSTGIHITDLGQVTSPMLYFATHHLPTHSATMITGSHNPKNYNGLKIVVRGQTLTAEDIQKLYVRACEGRFAKGAGTLNTYDIFAAYQKAIVDRIHLKHPLKVVIDCGNGIAGKYAPIILAALGCEVIPLFCEVDGNFPNHHPDPSRAENLNDCIQAVRTHQADIAIALDGDADRLGLVTNLGTIIWPDRQLMAFAADVLKKHPGAPIVFDVKCSQNLATVIRQANGEPIMWKTGHSVIKHKMSRIQAPLAGEMSGHIFFADDWYGFDDGLFAGCRMLVMLAAQTQDAETYFKNFPDSIHTPELMIAIPDDEKFAFIEALHKAANRFAPGQVNAIDGLRVTFAEGWGLVRASNTTPNLTLRFEADSEEALLKIQLHFKTILLELKPDLQCPF